MQQMNDDELSKLLSEWRVPRAPASLEARVFAGGKPCWWQWLLRGRIQVPVPVAAAALLALLIWGALHIQGELDTAARPGPGLSGFQIAEDLNLRIIRGTHENH